MIRRVELKSNGSTVAAYAWAHVSQDVRRVVNTALDGTVYYQTVGSATGKIKVDGVVTAAQRSALESAERNGGRLSCVSGGSEIYGGLITKLEFDDEYRGLYERFEAEMVVTA